jgi:hypothetical protein
MYLYNLKSYNSRCKSYIDELPQVLNTGDDKSFKQLFYVKLHGLMMGQWGSKHVAVDVLKHYCDSNDVCAFVGWHLSIVKI